MPRKAKSTALYKIRRKLSDPPPAPVSGRAVRPRRPNQKADPQVSPTTKALALRDEQLAIGPVAAVVPEPAQPFLKWVGGKAQLLVQLEAFFPTQIGRYVEPFTGGGAVFFHLKQKFPTMRAFLRDNNDELINTYRVVRQQPREKVLCLR